MSGIRSMAMAMALAWTVLVLGGRAAGQGLADAPPPSSAAGTVIHLEDIVAGGDGSGTAPADVTGIDPRTGEFTTSYFEGRIFETDGVNPQPVPASPYVESVFLLLGQVPTAEDGCSGCFVQRITQSGVQLWLSDAEESGSGWNYILKNRAGGVGAPGLRIGSRDYFTTSIGIHASMGITFDLDQLRAQHGAEAVGCFSAFFGLDDCSIGLVRLLAMVSNDAEGVTDIRNGVYGPGQGEFVNIPIPANARYLTLVSASVNGIDNCDHGTFARPVITPLPCPQTPDVWIWGLSPWRVRPQGEPISVYGEALFDGYSLQIGGQPLIDDTYVSEEERSGIVPPLPSGIYDLEVIWDGGVLYRLPRGIEVAPPPVLTSVSPATVLADRETPVLIQGANLRSDMTFFVDFVGPGGASVPLLDAEVRSSQLVSGRLPRLDPSMSPLGPKAITIYDQGRRREFPGLVVYAEVGLSGVEPNVVSTRGGTAVTFTGIGFDASMGVRIGGQPVTALEISSSFEARGTSPVLPAGSHDVELVSGAGQVLSRLSQAVTAVEPAPLAIASVTPDRIFSLGGAEIIVKTTSAHKSATPLVAGIPLVNSSVVDAITLRGEVPPLEPGSYDVELADASGEVIAVARGALQVLADSEISIAGVSPRTVSTLGGTEVTFTGSGFSPGFVPRLGGAPLLDVEVVSTSTLRGVSPPLVPGFQDAALDAGGLIVATFPRAVNAVSPDLPSTVIGQVRPARITAGSRVRFIGTDLPDDVVPRVGGVPLDDFRAISPCRIEARFGSAGDGDGAGLGAASFLAPGFYVADLYRPGFGVVAELESLVEVAAPGAAPRPTHVVSAAVESDGSTQLFVFGNDFRPETRITVGGRPLLDAVVASDELIVGRAPPLGAGEDPGLRDLRAEDFRGGATLANGVRYAEPDTAGGGTQFVRGDPNASGSTDLSDAVFILGFLFLGRPATLDCADAADADGNGGLDISDAVFLLRFLFLGGPEPPRPFPRCGAPDESRLGCARFTSCEANRGAAHGAVPFVFRENVKLLAETPVNPLDPAIVELEAEAGEIVIRDLPGGVDVRPGDVIAGFTPVHLDAVHNGVSYLLKVDREVAGSCFAAGSGEKVFKVDPATLKDIGRSGAVTFKQSDFFGARVLYSKTRITGLCDAIAAFGAGQEVAEGRGHDTCVSDCISINVDKPPFDLVDLNYGDSYVRIGLKRCKVLYNSGTELGVEFSDDGVDRSRFFSGVRFDSEVEFYVDAHAHEELKKEESLWKYQKSTIIYVGFPPVLIPILITVEVDIVVGVDVEAGFDMYADAGAKAHFKTGLGFEFDGERLRNTTTFDFPTLEPLPGTPQFDFDGFVSIKGYVRPKLRLFGGLAIAVLTGNLRITPELYTRAHASGSTNPPCFEYGIDLGATFDVHPEIQFIGFDLWDPPEAFRLVDEEFNDLISDQFGCKKPPVAVVSRRLEQVGSQLHVHLDASGSYDPDGGPLEFRWDFDGDGECDRNTHSDPRTTFIFDPASGTPCRTDFCTHQVRLRVTDDENTFTETATSFRTRGSGLIQEARPRLP